MNPQNLLQNPVITQKCTFGCPILDHHLGGGIPCNSVTEIVAESGSGKTQLCLQLSLSAQLPVSRGGLAASSIYLYTEFPFPIRRLKHLSRTFDSSNPNTNGDPCENVFVRKVHSADNLLDIMSEIETFVELSRNIRRTLPVRLILVDSIAAIFRSDFDNTPSDLKKRSSLFFKISGKLKALAKSFNLAVVVTNQVVDFVGPNEGMNGLRVGNLRFLYSSGRRVCPALGLAWSNCVNSRLFLSRDEEVVREEKGNVDAYEDRFVHRKMKRQLHVVFAPHLAKTACEYVITSSGVFGVEG